jgi:hypothetical protein
MLPLIRISCLCQYAMKDLLTQTSSTYKFILSSEMAALVTVSTESTYLFSECQY